MWRVLPLAWIALAGALALLGCGERLTPDPQEEADFEIRLQFPEREGLPDQGGRVYRLQRLQASAMELRSGGREVLRAQQTIDLPDTATQFRVALQVPVAESYRILVDALGIRGGGRNATEFGTIFLGDGRVEGLSAEEPETVEIRLEDVVPHLDLRLEPPIGFSLAWDEVAGAARYRLKEIAPDGDTREFTTAGLDTMILFVFPNAVRGWEPIGAAARQSGPQGGADLRLTYRVRAEFQGIHLSAYSESVGVTVPEVAQPGRISGRVLNEAGSPVNDALIKVVTCANQETGLQATSGTDGSFAIENVPPDSYFLQILRAGCRAARDPVQSCFPVVSGETSVRDPILLDCAGIWASITLTWGETPEDLDLHLWTPSINDVAYHVYWGNHGSSDGPPEAVLDQDDQGSFGPENLTLDQGFPGLYTVAVHHYTGEGTITTSSASVRITDADGNSQAIQVPQISSQPNWWWYVCTIDGKTGRVTPLGEISSVPPVGVPRAERSRAK